MNSLIVDFVQLSCAIAKSLFLERRLVTTLCLRLILRFSKKFLISFDRKS